jgi:hypothetical protein
MLVAILFALTALVTGLHNVYLLMDVVNGAPINLLNCIALFGSVVLLIAAVLAPARLRVAAKTGLAGSLLLWVFYSTTIVIWFSMPFSAWQEIRTFITFREYVPLTGMLLGPILSTVCTATELWTIKATS